MKSQMSYCRRDHRWWLCLRDLCRSGVPIIAILCMGLLPGCVFLPSVKGLGAARRHDDARYLCIEDAWIHHQR